MKFGITSDSHWESKIDTVHRRLSDLGFRQYFETKSYGLDVTEIFVILMCRDAQFNQRIRYSKKDRILYIDIMFDLNQFKIMSQEEREKTVAKNIVSEIPLIISKYNFQDFNLEKFQKDLTRWFKQIDWL